MLQLSSSTLMTIQLEMNAQYVMMLLRKTRISSAYLVTEDISSTSIELENGLGEITHALSERL
jgi:hypothetical protein